jgi:hypothetical protein
MSLRSEANKMQSATYRWRAYLCTILALFMVAFTTVECRTQVLQLQSKFGLERLCEDENTGATQVNLHLAVRRVGRAPFEPRRPDLALAVPVSQAPKSVDLLRRAARAPPHCPRAPPLV